MAHQRPILLLVTDRTFVEGTALYQNVKKAVAGGVDWVQIREKEFTGLELTNHARSIQDAAREGASQRQGSVKIFINRFVDVAIVIGADGVHLGFDAMPSAAARELLPRNSLITSARHDVDEVIRRKDEPIDAVQLAPIFNPISKRPERIPAGIESLKKAVRAAPFLKILAQGGITPENAAHCIQAGACGVAVTGSLLQAKCSKKRAEELRSAIDRVGSNYAP